MGDAPFTRLPGVQPGLGREGLVAHHQRAGVGCEQAGQHIQQFALPVARDTGDADDLTGVQLQRHIGQALHPQRIDDTQALGLQEHGTGLGRGAFAAQVDAPAHHGFGQAVDAGVGDGAVQHHLAATHHGHGVAQRHDLLELVRDEQDGRAARAQAAQRGEERVCFLRREHGGGLVQDQDACAAVQGFEDLQPLAFTDRQVRYLRIQVDLHAGVVHQHVELGPHLGARGVQAPAGLGPQHHVVQRAQRVHEHEVLVHHADAQGNRLAAAGDARGLALDLDLARIGLVEAVEDGHQRALAGAVFTDDAVHSAGGHAQLHVAVGLHGAEALVDVAHLDRRGGGGGWHYLQADAAM